MRGIVVGDLRFEPHLVGVRLVLGSPLRRLVGEQLAGLLGLFEQVDADDPDRVERHLPALDLGGDPGDDLAGRLGRILDLEALRQPPLLPVLLLYPLDMRRRRGALDDRERSLFLRQLDDLVQGVGIWLRSRRRGRLGRSRGRRRRGRTGGQQHVRQAGAHSQRQGTLEKLSPVDLLFL